MIPKLPLKNQNNRKMSGKLLKESPSYICTVDKHYERMIRIFFVGLNFLRQIDSESRTVIAVRGNRKVSAMPEYNLFGN